jgi:hypothetical protein
MTRPVAGKEEDTMQDTRTTTADERDPDARADEMRAAQPTATTADIAGVDKETTIDKAEAVKETPPADEPVTEHAPPEAARPATTDEPDATPLFDDAVTGELRDRWTDVQTAFVDEPRSAVEQADALVADVMKRLATGFADERRTLEGQWTRGDDVSTEDLRLALQRYRSFFDRLLSV